MATQSDPQSQTGEHKQLRGCSEQSVIDAPYGYVGPRSFWCNVIWPFWRSYFEKTSWDRGELLEALRHALEHAAQTEDQKGQPLPPNDELQQIGSLAQDIVGAELLEHHRMFLKEAHQMVHEFKDKYYIESKMWRIIEELFKRMVIGLARHATGGKGDPAQLWDLEKQPLRDIRTNDRLRTGYSVPTPCAQQPDTPDEQYKPSTCGDRWDLVLNPIWLEFIDLVISECHDLQRLNDFVGRAYARGGRRCVRSPRSQRIR